MKKKVLVIASHPDDEVLGCGGTLIKLKKVGYKIKVIFTSDCKIRNKLGLENFKKLNERFELAKIVSLKLGFERPIFLKFPNLEMNRLQITQLGQELKKIIQDFKPNIIFTHYYNDIHDDHRATYESVMISIRLKNFDFIEKVLLFETPSATDSFYKNKIQQFSPNVFYDISDQIQHKLKILKIYNEELLKYPNTRSLIGIENLSKFRGNYLKLFNAEAFELVWEKIIKV